MQHTNKRKGIDLIKDHGMSTKYHKYPYDTVTRGWREHGGMVSLPLVSCGFVALWFCSVQLFQKLDF